MERSLVDIWNEPKAFGYTRGFTEKYLGTTVLVAGSA